MPFIGFQRASLALASLALAAVAAAPVQAQTVAYYRFENGADLQTAATPILDSVGGHDLTVEAGSDARYRAVVPTSVIPQTGQPDTRSMEFTSLASFASADATFNTFAFPTWTIEAYVNFKQLTGFQTFVGKDSPGLFADVYFQRNARNGAFSIYYQGTDGNLQGFDGVFTPSANTWYHVAAVNDGSSLALYVNGVLDMQAPTTMPFVQRNTAWTIGRGYFNGPSDPSFALVDEVRFSGTALRPDQFLGAAAPEPGSIALLTLAGASAIGLAARHRGMREKAFPWRSSRRK